MKSDIPKEIINLNFPLWLKIKSLLNFWSLYSFSSWNVYEKKSFLHWLHELDFFLFLAPLFKLEVSAAYSRLSNALKTKLDYIN